MKKRHLLFIIFYCISFVNVVVACPCMSSNNDAQPFFEEPENQNNENSEENNEETEE